MTETELPKPGDIVAIEKFHVSKMNVRYGEPFGGEEDQQLIANLREGKIIGPFRARPEGEGYGVIVGRRRFLAKKESGIKFFVVAKDCLIEEIDDEEAREASLVENLEILRKNMNSITRAKTLNELIAFSPGGLRSMARRLGIPASTLSEWLKVLQLSPKMQEMVAKDKLFFTDALKLARMGLGVEKQNELAEILEEEGLDSFLKALERANVGKLKRGLPKDIYEVDRILWDKRSRNEMRYYEAISKIAKQKGVTVPDFIKDFLIKHIKEIETEFAG